MGQRRCHVCEAEVRDGQRFCHDCGASLKDVADDDGGQLAAGDGQDTEISSTAAKAAAPFPPPPPPSNTSTGSNDETLLVSHGDARGHGDRGDDQPTIVMPRSDAARRTPAGGDERYTEDPTRRLPVDPISQSTAATVKRQPPPDTTGQMGTIPYAPAAGVPGGYEPRPDERKDRHEDRARFRLRPLLLLAVLAAAGTAIGLVSNTITVVTDAGASAGFEVGDWKVNDFGTNNTVAAIIAASAMVGGALAWCLGARWGAGLAGGAGAALAGWSALLIGRAEFPIAVAERSGLGVTVTRDIGYWAVAGGGAVGVLVLLVSLAAAGRDGHSGLDPWIAALGAASFLLAAGGPLIPQNDVGIEANYESTTVDLPAMFFIGRAVQLGLLVLCGVVGFLTVRRYGLGLAIGGALAAGWMLVTAATGQTDSPIGPAFANPGANPAEPHAVTIVGMALVGFFALVAVVMAVLDSDR